MLFLSSGDEVNKYATHICLMGFPQCNCSSVREVIVLKVLSDMLSKQHLRAEISYDIVITLS